jgi:hypothetical protein
MSVLDDLREHDRSHDAEYVRESDYLREVDDLLLPLPWRRRQRALADLRNRLGSRGTGTTDPLRATADSYVAEVLNAERRRRRVPITLRPLVSCVWPSPTEWLAASLRGIALVLGAVIGFGMMDNLAHTLMWDGMASYTSAWRAMATPLAATASRACLNPGSGLAGTLLVGAFAGQLLNGRRLARDARARRHQRASTLVAVVWLLLVAAWTVPTFVR